MRVQARLCGVLVMLALSAAAQQPIETVEVVGQTPLGAGVDADRLAANVQVVDAEEIAAQRALDLADFMRRNLASVFVNEAQSNPLQPDLQYRGFVGSPLLGLPQGIAVYQDGVRINEPFGDTVNWVLIPDAAIETVYLMPGSNPLFGLNALGGAISIDTKDGFTNDGSRAQVYAGSFGRLGAEAQTGGTIGDRLGYFLTGSYLDEDGWRDHSPSEAVQLFGKLGWQFDDTTLDFGLNLADTDLIGNGPAPVQLLELDRRSIFTRPDITQNELALANLQIEHDINAGLALSGNVYVRRSDVTTLNGDDSEFEECEDAVGLLCEFDDGEEEILADAGGAPIVADDSLEGATINRTQTRQRGRGFGLQATWNGRLRAHDNLLVLGMAWDDADVEFVASTELGALDASRMAVPGGIFVGDAFTDLTTDNETLSVFVSNTFSLPRGIALNVSGRYNDTSIRLRDRLGTALSGDHDFSRFNPAIGLTLPLSGSGHAYVSYSESNRTPTPVELTCADEDDPCRLPNAFLADPPLEQVVAGTFEFGFRGEWTGGNWHAGAFRTVNDDDILFISAGALTNQGYFDNVGRTRRDGVELSLHGVAHERLSWFVNYTYLEATFRDAVVLPSANNPAALDGEVRVAPGDRLPLIPGQLLKFGLQASLGSRLRFGADLIAGSDFYMRGDEGNDFAAIGDYMIVNLRGEYRLSDSVRFFLDIDNVLDRDYESFGLFGEPDEVLGDEFDDSRFLSPAAPRAAWLGIEVELGRR